MSRTRTHKITQSTFSKKDDYVMLVKLRLSLLVVFTSVIGFIIASGGLFEVGPIVMLSIAGILVTGAANALNQVLEKDYDVHMERTKDRPIAAGRMKSSEAVMFAGISCLIGISILALFNPLTALLGMLSLITYAFVYTPLKRYSTIAVAIGAIPGALPVLIGYTAWSGEITVLAIVLFAIQFLWQFPHFWSIGYLAFEDYQKAGYKLLPVQDGKMDRNVGMYAAVYALLIVPIVIWCFSLGYGSMPSMIIAVVSSVVYTLCSIYMFRKNNKKSALLLMFSSFFYLPIVLMGYLIGL
jgi:protoheme IX farnesyltransferase